MDELTPARLAQLADTLAVEAKTGMHWARNHYDQERYERILAIAATLLAGTLSVPVETATRWYTDDPGTLTAKVGASVAAFDDAGRILLIQRNDNEKWAMPGGIVEYGETLATAAAREVWEESGMRVRIVALLGMYDARRHGFVTVHNWVHVVFRGEIIDGTPGPSDETLTAGFFTESEASALPLSPGHDDTVRDAFAAYRTAEPMTFFDP